MAGPWYATPLDGRWPAMGAHLTEVAGWRVPERFGDGAEEAGAAREGVALGDETPRAKLLVQGEGAGPEVSTATGLTEPRMGEEAAGVVAAATGSPAPRLGEVSGNPVAVCRLRPDLLLVGAGPGEGEEVLAALEGAAAEAPSLVTVTDVTHGRFEYRIVGPKAPRLLSKVCGLDFDAGAFPDRRARETSVARVKALVVRADAGDLPAFRVLGGRALGAYVWDILMEAGAELGIAPIGAAALRELQA